MTKAQPDLDAALEFLFKRMVTTPIHLAAIHPDGGNPSGKLFLHQRPDGTRMSPKEFDEQIKSWIADRNGPEGLNVYLTLNTVRRSFKGNKPAESDITEVRTLQVDLDPRSVPDGWQGTPTAWVDAERARILVSLTTELPPGVPGPPTLVIDSGGGYWGLWLLRLSILIEKPEDIDRVKTCGQHLIELYRAHLGVKDLADGVANIDRLCRLPGSLNYPSKRKREQKGRTTRLASLVEDACSGQRYGLTQFAPPEGFKKPKVGKRMGVQQGPQGNRRIDSLEELPTTVTDFAKVVIAQGCDPDEPGRFGGTPSMFGLLCGSLWNGDRSAAVFYVACELVRSRVDDDTICSLFLDKGWGISAHVLDQSNPEACAHRQIERARDAVGDDIRRPVIYSNPGRLAEIVAEGSRALLEAKVPIYQRGAELVYPVRLDRSESEDGVRRDRGATVIHPISSAWLTVALARAAQWRKRGGADPAEDKPTDPQEKHAKAILSQVGNWMFPVLRGIVTAPTLRADGSLLQVPGYDPASRLIFEPGGVKFPPIPEHPTREDAVAALRKLDPLFAGFPFVDENARAVAYSAILSGLVGQVLPAIPLHAFDAPTAGTGKSLLAETVGAIVLGHKPSAMNQGKEPAEDEKRLSTALRAGDRIIWIDNVEKVITGDTLCSILTQEFVLLRILCRSEQVSLPCNVLVMATGNNLQIGGDVTRRSVVCRLDSKDERPDQRQFDFNPREVAAERRIELVVAGLTALRAYVVAGRPMRLSTVGSFERWSEWVRETLVWCGYGDPDATRTAVLADDPKKAELVEVLETWFTAWGHDEVTVKQARQSQELEAALIDAIGRPPLGSKSVGWWLKRHMDRLVGGLVLRRRGTSSGSARWCVESLDGRPSERGQQVERDARDAAVLG